MRTRHAALYQNADASQSIDSLLSVIEHHERTHLRVAAVEGKHEMGTRDTIRQMDTLHHLHPFSNFKRHEKEGPLIISRGEGVWVYDDQGKRYLEGLAGLWCASLGFNNKRLIAAAKNQLDRLPYYHTFYQRTSDVTAELSGKLADMIPMDHVRILFANSGSEAIDMAIKLIWYYNNARGMPSKKKIISRLKAYHGVTIASGSATGLPIVHSDFDLPISRFLHTDCPHYYINSLDGESVSEFVDRIVGNLERLIQSENPDTIAAFLAEPIQGSGGVIVPPQSYFEKVQAILKKYDILFLADEVICGFCRTGNMFGSETFGLSPDLMTLAKGLSSGYQPISALAVSDTIYKVVSEASARNGVFGHGFTYSGHPVAAAVALEALKIYAEGDVLAHVRSIQDRFQSGLRQFATHTLVGEVRGIGLIAGVQLMADRSMRSSFDPVGMAGARFTEVALKHGLLTRALGDTIALCPPLIIQEGEIDLLLQIMGVTLDETYNLLMRG
jgi:4-aminobutyrate--pyruvate transaminase